MVDTSQSPALGFMQIVPDRTAATLLPILQQHVAPGSVVLSDQWASYNQVGNLPNVSAHGTVNHSMEFVSPSGVHTQNIESYWNRTKMKLKRMRGCAAKEVPSYLDEFMWRERFGKTPREVLNGIMRVLHNNILFEPSLLFSPFFFFVITGFFQSHHFQKMAPKTNKQRNKRNKIKQKDT